MAMAKKGLLTVLFAALFAVCGVLGAWQARTHAAYAQDTAPKVVYAITDSIGDNAYNSFLQEYLNSGSFTVNNKVTLNGMRAEELRYLVDRTYNGDNYTAEKFPALVTYRENTELDVMTADQIILSVGSANLGSQTVSTLCRVIEDKFGVTLGDTTDYGFDLSTLLTEETQGLYDTIFETLDKALNAGGKLSSNALVELFGAENTKKVVNAYAYGFLGFMTHYVKAVEGIHAINPAATIVVVGLYNTLDGLKFEFEGATVDVGTIAGLLFDGANMMLASKINNIDGVYFAYPGKAQLMLEDIAAGRLDDNFEYDSHVRNLMFNHSLDDQNAQLVDAFKAAFRAAAVNPSVNMAGVMDLFERADGTTKTLTEVLTENVGNLLDGGMQDLLTLNIRMSLGGGVGANLSGNSAIKVAGKIESAIKDCYDGGDYLTEAVKTLNRDFDNYATALLKSGMLGAVKELTDNVYFNRLIDALLAAEDFDATHSALMEGAQSGEYTVTGSSKYVALGDAQHMDKNSATNLFAAEIFGAEAASRYRNLSTQGMRVEDLLYLLDGTLVPDDYFNSRFNVVSDYDKYVGALEGADLISLSFGGEGVYRFVLEQILRAMDGKAALAVNWEQFVEPDVAEKIDGLKTKLKQMMHLPESLDLAEISKGMIDGVIDVELVFDTVLHAYLGHLTSYAKAVEAIHALNPSAKIILFGYFNPMQGLVMPTDGKNIPMGEFVDIFLKVCSMHALTFTATAGDYVTYIDLVGVVTSAINEEWPEDNATPTPVIADYMMELIVRNGSDLLLTADGQAVVKNKLTDSFKVTCAHIFDNACDSDCNACGTVRDVPDHVYDNACDPSCNICGAERTVGEHQYLNCTAQVCSICGGGIRVSSSCQYSNVCDKDCNVCGFVRDASDHEYDHACDKDCNVCGEVREVPDHVYSNACDSECNVKGCGFVREVPDHVYDTACDAYCNECNFARTPANHVYDNNCADTTCNVCGGFRQYADHVYDNACDATCNNCAVTRDVSGHVYDNDCDSDCNECGEQRTIAGHVYDNKCDNTCNVCGTTRNVGAHVYDDGNDPTCNECGLTRDVGGGGCFGYVDSVFAVLGVAVLGLVKAITKRKE